MADFLKFFRVLALPAQLQPDSIYLVKVDATTADMVITGNDAAPYNASKGPPGDPGAPGADSTVPGPPADTYEHLQTSASDVWVVNHNFGRNPVIAVIGPAGREVEADVLHTSLNQSQVSFNQPITGKALAR